MTWVALSIACVLGLPIVAAVRIGFTLLEHELSDGDAQLLRALAGLGYS